MSALPISSIFTPVQNATRASERLKTSGGRKETEMGVMLKALYAIAAAAIVAGAFVATLSISEQVEASGSAPGIKADRADVRPLGGKCSQNAWPYFEAACLRDTRNPFGEARHVRVVSTDRLAGH
jgi:hypothetical protein